MYSNEDEYSWWHNYLCARFLCDRTTYFPFLCDHLTILKPMYSNELCIRDYITTYAPVFYVIGLRISRFCVIRPLIWNLCIPTSCVFVMTQLFMRPFMWSGYEFPVIVWPHYEFETFLRETGSSQPDFDPLVTWPCPWTAFIPCTAHIHIHR